MSTTIDAAIIKALVDHIGGDSSGIPDGTIGGGGPKYTSGDGIFIDANNKISVSVGSGLSINDLSQIALNIGSELNLQKVEANTAVMTPSTFTNELYTNGADYIDVRCPIVFGGFNVKVGGIEDLATFLEDLDERLRLIEQQ